jgi:hypothetical protein
VRNRRRSGSTIVEFALVAPLLLLLLIGSFSIGLSLSRMLQAGQVCRNANVLVVRGFDLSTSQNQTLVVRTAQGLGMNLTGTQNPDPNGKGVVILTKVIKVGPLACATGVPNYNGNTSTCPNYDKYVIASRIVIGNGTKWQSKCGNPSSTPSSNGDITDYDIAMTTGNRAQNFADSGATIVTLSQDEFAYVSEVFVDSSDLVIPYLMTTSTIAVRNVS